MMQVLESKAQLGGTNLSVPPVIFGSSCLGNLYQVLDDEVSPIVTVLTVRKNTCQLRQLRKCAAH